MNAARMGGIARAHALNARERSRIARRAARKRWSRAASVLPLASIRRAVKKALDGMDAAAYLFGSYGRGEATSRSDIDILVVKRKLSADWLAETTQIRRALGFSKRVDLIVLDANEFRKWKGEYGTIQYEVAREGVRLV